MRLGESCPRFASRALAMIVVVPLAVFATGCGGGASSADDAARIARSLRSDIDATAQTAARRERFKEEASEAVCTALDAYGSNAAGTLADALRQEAARHQLAQLLGYEPENGVPSQLLATANAIESSQQASEVASLFCP
jgi:hypothetical protein